MSSTFRYYPINKFKSVAVTAFFICLASSYAFADEWSKEFEDGQWNELNLSITHNWGVEVDSVSNLSGGWLEWYARIGNLHFDDRYADIDGHVGIRFAYDSPETRRNWVEMTFAYNGYLNDGLASSADCTMRIQLYEGGTLLYSHVAFARDASGSGWEDSSKVRAVYFPCVLESGLDYKILLKVDSRIESEKWWCGAISDFNKGSRTVDLNKIKIWHSDDSTFTAWEKTNHPNSDDYVSRGEYYITQDAYDMADTLLFTSYNEDSRINAYRIWIRRFSESESARVTKRHIDGKAWGDTILADNEVFMKVDQYLDEKNSQDLDYEWKGYNTGLQSPRRSPSSAPSHGWRVGYPTAEGNRYKHVFTMVNNHPTDSLKINGLSFFASPDSLAHMTSIDFTGPYYKCSIGPGEFIAHDVYTDYLMLGGYIYFKYSITDPMSGDVIINAWGGHEINVTRWTKEGDPALLTGLPGGIIDVTPNTPEVFSIQPANLANVSGTCTEADTFGLLVRDTKGWTITGDPPLGQGFVLAPGSFWDQDIVITPPLTNPENDTNMVFVSVVYCDSTDYSPPVPDDCEDPNWFGGVPYFSADTLLLAVPGPTGVPAAPARDYLSQNYPNPFNPSTTIRYGIARPGRVTLRIYDVTGRLVRVLVDRNKAAGDHKVTWDGRNNKGVQVASGVYFYRLIAVKYQETKKLVLLR